MILRSLTKHVKDQNWFAVWIDFAIVVLGVFIGIQVANWNETQAERAQTQRMLSAVLSDLETFREELERHRNYHFNTTTSLDALLSKLDAGEATQSDEVLAVVEQAATVSMLPSLPMGLEELLVVARLDLLEQGPTRDALRDLAKSARFNEGFQAESLRVFNSALDELYPYVSIDRAPSLEGDQEAYTVEAVDIEGIWASEGARVAMTKFYVYHSNMQGVMQSLLHRVDALIAEPGNTSLPSS